MSPGKNCSIVFTKLLNNLSICEREIRDLTRVSDLLKWEFGKLGQNCSIKSPNFESNFSPNVNSTALATARCSSMALESIIEKCSNNKVQMEEGIDLLKKTLSRTKCLCGVDCPVAGMEIPISCQSKEFNPESRMQLGRSCLHPVKPMALPLQMQSWRACLMLQRLS